MLSLIDRFEKVKSEFNRCVIIVSKHHKNPRIDLEKSLIEYHGPLKAEIIQKINNSKCQGIVVHTLNDDILELSLNLSSRIPVIWKSWGPDLHDLLYPGFNLLLPYTQKLVKGKNIIDKYAKDIFSPLYKKLTGREKEGRDRMLKKLEFLKRINYIATVTGTEFKMLQKRIPELKAKYLQLNYRSLDINKLPGLNTCIHDNAMIGHSSYSYHNHADVFYQLKSDSYNRTLVVPLSYGNAVYREKIIGLGKRLFKKQIDFLTDFLKFEDYLEFINHCSSFILNSKVQSGGGNIIYFLFQGSKVYLREENPIYLDYKEMGIKMFSIQKDLTTKHLLNSNFSMADKLQNRQKIESMFNSQKEKDNVLNVYNSLGISV